MATSKIQRATRERVLLLLKGFDLIENHRPDWLRNPKTGRRLEIDLYLPEVKVGIEVQGEQHFRFIPGLHSTQADFEAQQERDRVKKVICQQQGVFLYEVIKIGDIDGLIENIHEHHPDLGWELYKKNCAMKALGYFAEKMRVLGNTRRNRPQIESLSRRIISICKKYNIPIESVKPDPTIKKIQLTYNDHAIVRYDRQENWTKGKFGRRGALLRIEEGIAIVTDIYQRVHRFDLQNEGKEVDPKYAHIEWKLDMSTLPQPRTTPP